MLLVVLEICTVADNDVQRMCGHEAACDRLDGSVYGAEILAGIRGERYMIENI